MTAREYLEHWPHVMPAGPTSAAAAAAPRNISFWLPPSFSQSDTQGLGPSSPAVMSFPHGSDEYTSLRSPL